MEKTCYQINLQHHFGGGEVYTHFFSKALVELGWKVVLFTDPRADFWHTMDMGEVSIIPVADANQIPAHLPTTPSLIISHAPLKAELVAAMTPHVRCCFAHMPFYQRSVEPFKPYDVVLGVSRYVLDSAAEQGLNSCYGEPLYGVADAERMQASPTPIKRAPAFDWDERKVRDKLLSYIYPLCWQFAAKPEFNKRPGLTLGIVSRITPIKQLPLMFTHLAPILAKHPQINIEIFGSGGYASMRDLKHALTPIRAQTRFWGHQRNIGAIFPQLDFMLTGLPEKEALGLNVIEAQMAGTPILAPKAPPFTETVVEGETGHFYVDPRQDGGHHFDQLIKRLLTEKSWPRPLEATRHLEKFSFAAFVDRCQDAMAYITEQYKQRTES